MKNIICILTSVVAMILLAPVTSTSQTLDADGSFTLNAFIIGSVIVGVIGLVFLGLMLFARVNELLTWRDKPLQEKSTVNRLEEIMNLSESEIETFLHERTSDVDSR